MDFDVLIKDLEDLIKSGEAKKAKLKLFKVTSTHFTREQRLHLATLCRRVGIPLRAIKLLSPIVRPEPGLEITASDKEKLEYAANLNHIGAYKEALEILDSIDEKKEPSVLVQKAFGHTRRWNYRAAKQELINFLQLAKGSDLDSLQQIAKSNLASCHIFLSEYDQALDVLSDVYKSSELNYPLLHNYCNLQFGQVYYFKNMLEKSKEHLSLAAKTISGSNLIYNLAIEKWLTLIELKLNPSHGLVRLNNLKTLAANAKEWEIIRDCDFYEALATQNHELITKVYHGTPFPIYKENIRENFSKVEFENNYELISGSQTKNQIDLLTGQLAGTKAKLKLDSLPYLFLRTLMSDFYRPCSEGFLFATLYQHEYFNPATSPMRVFQISQQLNKWFKSNKLNIRIVRKNHNYELKLDNQTSFVVNNSGNPSNEPQYISILKGTFNEKEFSSNEASQVLKIHLRKANRIIRKALDNNLVYQIGSKNNRRYKIAS